MRLTPVDCAVRAFGGVRPLATAIRQYPGSVCQWRTRQTKRRAAGDLPTVVQRRVLEVARERGLQLSAEDLILGREA